MILHDWEKDYTCPDRCLLTWQNEKKSWQKKSMQHIRFCFISVGVRAVLRFLVSIKKLGQYKKFPWDKFVKKKRTFRKIFHGMWNFLELQCLVDELNDC